MSETHDKLDLACVHGPLIDRFWAELFPLVVDACDETLTTRDVYAAIHDDNAIAWLILDADESIKAAAVTQVLENDAHRWMVVLTLGGQDFAKWSQALQAEFEQYAAETGCQFIRAQCRRGMAKWLKRLGWRERIVTMEWRDGR